MLHVQCKLRKGNSYFTSWLPEKLARKGNILDFDEEGKGWKIISTGAKSDSKKILNRKSNIFASIK